MDPDLLVGSAPALYSGLSFRAGGRSLVADREAFEAPANF